jgi:hypothetical protein
MAYFRTLLVGPFAIWRFATKLNMTFVSNNLRLKINQYQFTRSKSATTALNIILRIQDELRKS